MSALFLVIAIPLELRFVFLSRPRVTHTVLRVMATTSKLHLGVPLVRESLTKCCVVTFELLFVFLSRPRVLHEVLVSCHGLEYVTVSLDGFTSTFRKRFRAARA